MLIGMTKWSGKRIYNGDKISIYYLDETGEIPSDEVRDRVQELKPSPTYHLDLMIVPRYPTFLFIREDEKYNQISKQQMEDIISNAESKGSFLDILKRIGVSGQVKDNLNRYFWVFQKERDGSIKSNIDAVDDIKKTCEMNDDEIEIKFEKKQKDDKFEGYACISPFEFIGTPYNDEKKSDIWDKLLNRSKMRRFSPHYFVTPIKAFQGETTCMVQPFIGGMSTENVLSYFESKKRKGSKIDTLIASSGEFRKNAVNDKPKTGEMFFVQLSPFRTDETISWLPVDFMYSIADRLKVVNSVKDNNKVNIVVEVVHHESSDFLKFLYSFAEENETTFMYAIDYADMNKVISQ